MFHFPIKHMENGTHGIEVKKKLKRNTLKKGLITKFIGRSVREDLCFIFHWSIWKIEHVESLF